MRTPSSTHVQTEGRVEATGEAEVKSPALSPRLRKINLTAHVASSVGWLGAVVGFLVLSVVGLTSQEPQVVRSCYVAMNIVGWSVNVPLSFAALLTGLAQSLGTHWGLFRHYWVLIKLTLTLAATALLLLHQFTAVEEAAHRVSEAGAITVPMVGRLGTQLVVDAGLAILILLVNTVLSVFKPWGRTPYGRRKLELAGPATSPTMGAADGSRLPLGLNVFLAIVLAFLLTVVIVHLARRRVWAHTATERP